MNPHLESTTEPWLAIARNDGDGTFFSAWLSYLAGSVDGASEAVLIIGDANVGPFSPAAFWPKSMSCGEDMALICEQTLGMRMPLTQSGRRGLIAVPVLHESDIFGVVALAFSGKSVPSYAAERVRWGLGWLLLHCRRHDDEAAEELRERLMASLGLMMSALDEANLESACQAVVTDAAVRLGCDRVSVGFCKGRSIRLETISHSADFSRRIDLTHAIEAVMNEAADQGVPVYLENGRVTEEGASQYLAARAHEILAHDFGNSTLLSLPFIVSEEQYGVFLFEWQADRVSAATRQLAEGISPILGRVLLEKRSNDRPLLLRMKDGIYGEFKRLLGPHHVGRKLVASLALLSSLFFTFAVGEFRVSAHSSLEGSVRRVIVAPFDGFVASASARAGHVVNEGDQLAMLDDRDIRLEASRWDSQQEQYAKQAQDAEAQHNLSQIQIAQAQIRQAEAQLTLSKTMLERARVRAPFAGVIVSGDLSQHLGGTVRKGQMLFEITPLDSYRIVLEVDESDIAHVSVGQRGELVVAALTGQKFPFAVKLVTPVAHVSEGKNYFRVEADLEKHTDQLRPGMEGISKINAGQRRLIWIWTRGMLDWLRLQLWNWTGV